MTRDAYDRVAAALARYANQARHSNWSAPGDLRENVSRRRRRKAKAALTALSLVAVFGLALVRALPATAPGRQALPVPSQHRPSITRLESKVKYAVLHSADEASVALAEQHFALALTAAASEHSSGDTLVSPESLDAVLSMLELGADGATLREIARVLGSPGLSSASQAKDWNALEAQLQSDAAGMVSIDDHNFVFLQQGLAVKPGFLNALKVNFDAGVIWVDSANAGVKAVNSWIDRQTGGQTPELFARGSLSRFTSVVAADVMRFSAGWGKSVSFLKARTAPALFYPAAAKSYRVEMMQTQLTRLFFSVTPQMQVVRLPYANGRFEAVLIEPLSTSLTSFVRSLTVGSLEAIEGGTHAGPVTLGMPRFSIKAVLSFDSALKSMGMAGSYTMSANFSGMSPDRSDIETIVQSNALSVNEWGTDEASATAGVSQLIATHGQSEPLKFDHPFLMIIRDVSTGVIVSDAMVTHPVSIIS